MIKGIAFKKAFSYAGFEMQPKHYKSPLIALLNIELELKAEKDNAELRIANVSDYQQVCRLDSRKIYTQIFGLQKNLSRLKTKKSNFSELKKSMYKIVELLKIRDPNFFIA